MLETELFSLLDHTGEAAYTVTERGEICSWNAAAEKLYGYSASEVLHSQIDEVLDGRDALGTAALAGGFDAAARHWDATSGGIPNFDLEVRTRSGDRLWVNISTIVFDNQRTGRRLFARLAHDISHRHRKEGLLDSMLEVTRQLDALTNTASDLAPVEPISEQERRILKLFAEGSNPAAIARKLNISAQTLRNHLHHVNRKLRTHNRLEAVTHARLRGVI